MSSSPEEFYIGYLPKAPQKLGHFLRIISFLLVILFCAGSIVFAVSQKRFSFSFFEFGKYRTFHGVIYQKPYPYLIVRYPSLAGQSPKSSVYLLVAPWKFGAETLWEGKHLENKYVSLKGSLIYKNNRTMIEVLPDSIQILSKQREKQDLNQNIVRLSSQKLGKMTLEGEIVDSKCYLGVMKPATHKIHRSCAVRCISGGIPPLLMVKNKKGQERQFLLVSHQGKAVNSQILDMIAKPVRITGYIEKKGNLFILKADPKNYVLLR